MLTEKEYKEYAEARLNINKRLPDEFSEMMDVLKAGRALGVVKGRTFTFGCETEQDSVIDFILQFVKKNGKTILEHAIERQIWENELEKEYLENFSCSKPALYKVTAVNPVTNTITVCDAFNEIDVYTITDIGASKSLIPDLLMYFTIVPVGVGFITNGHAFGYEPKYNEMIMFECNKHVNKVKMKDPVKAYKFFFKLFQRMGSIMQGSDVK